MLTEQVLKLYVDKALTIKAKLQTVESPLEVVPLTLERFYLRP